MHEISSLNPLSKIIQSPPFAQVAVPDILNVKGFDPSKCKALAEQKQEISSKPILIQRDSTGKIVRKRVNINFNDTVTTKSNIVSTISITTANALDFQKFNFWIVSILKNEGAKIYRMKGILNMAGFEETFVVHGIHMIFDGEKGAPWQSESRISKLVFIGVDLNRGRLESEFLQCEYSNDKYSS
jgi:G3E family GTPase